MNELLRRQQVRFLVAGLFNTSLDFALLNILTLAFDLPVLAANTVTVALGITVSYLLNHFFVFRYPEPARFGTFAKFVAVTGFSSLMLQNVIIFLFEMLFDTSFGNSLLFLPGEQGREFLAVNIAKASAVVVGLVWNYTMYRFVIFRTSPRGQTEDRITPG